MKQVGSYEKKKVTSLNHFLYTSAEKILNANYHQFHIGWSGVGKFIDWLEENYTITKKDSHETTLERK